MKTIDKKGWKKVMFGEVCSNLNVATQDPNAMGIDRYVGLEHLETENLRITSWGNVADGTTFTKTFKPGHVLFGKRRAYLKKAAVADFKGLCSSDILVFEANEKMIEKRLLPFLISSDRFFEYAVQTSAGSLSPRTKFQDLAKFEFLLPPKDQQAKLADLLWASDEVMERYETLAQVIQRTIKRFIDQEMVNDSITNSKLQYKPLKDFLKSKPQYGANSSAIPYLSNKPRYIRITDIDDEGRLIPTDKVTTELDDYGNYLLSEGDFLFARTGNTVGKTYLYKAEDGYAIYAGYLIRCIIDTTKLLPEYLALFCKSSKYDEFKVKTVKVGAQPNINAEQYANMLIPNVPIAAQRKIVLKYNTFYAGLNKVRESKKSASQIQKHLVNQIFSA